jgi:DNA-binding XRE family transcriptional regulator
MTMARNWREVKAEALASGHLTEEGLAKARSQLEDHLRAYLLAEVRKKQHVTQVEMARRLGVGQPRISQIERGDLDRAELATLRGYVEALGGQLEVSATFGEERLRIA